MTAQELHDKAWRLIEAAKTTMNPARRRMLMDEAFDLIREAKRVRERNPTQMNGHSSPPYRLWLMGDNGSLWVDLPLASKVDAIWAAEALGSACSAVYEDFSLWKGERCLYSGLTAHASFSPRTAVQVTMSSQKAVLETEELIQTSNHLLAKSRRLIDLIDEMRKTLKERPSA